MNRTAERRAHLRSVAKNLASWYLSKEAGEAVMKEAFEECHTDEELEVVYEIMLEMQAAVEEL